MTRAKCMPHAALAPQHTLPVCRACLCSQLTAATAHPSCRAGVHGSIGQANYATAKAGVVGLTKAVAKEWGPFGVRCNCLTYGYINTRCGCCWPTAGACHCGQRPGACCCRRLLPCLHAAMSSNCLPAACWTHYMRLRRRPANLPTTPHALTLRPPAHSC